MANIAVLIPELDAIIGHHSCEQRVQTLSRLTALFVEQSPLLNEDQVGLFDELFGRLISDVEAPARRELSCRLADVGNAPIEVSRRLARDEIAVAEPLLRTSTRLAEADLVSIAQTKGQAHLLAIATRPDLGEAVTDILVERGDGAVVKSLAENQSARLSARSLAALAKRNDHDGMPAQRISQHPHLPVDLFAGHAAAAPVTEPRASPRGEAEIRGLAKAGRRSETIVALSALCGVPAEVIERLVGGERSDPVLILCKAAGFSWPSVEAILALLPKGTASQSLDTACANFERLAPATARRVLRFWQARHDSAAAS